MRGKLISQLKGKLEGNPSILAFVLVGSQARKTIYQANQYSDLEAFIIVKDKDVKEVEQKLPEIVSSLGNMLFSFKHQIGFVVTFDDLFRLELPVVKQSDLKSVFSRPKAQEVKILFDKTGDQLKQILDKRPHTINFKELFRIKLLIFGIGR